MSVSRIDDQHVSARSSQRFRALDRVGADTNRRTHTQSSALVLGRIRMLNLLLDVFDVIKPGQPAIGVDDRKLLDLVAMEDLLGLGRVVPDGA